MNAVWNQIARTIFDRPDVENVSLEELDYLLEEYPYFPVIHFLRARKMIADQMPESAAAISRTSLYFPNPHWLQYQLDGAIQENMVETAPSFSDLPQDEDQPFQEDAAFDHQPVHEIEPEVLAIATEEIVELEELDFEPDVSAIASEEIPELVELEITPEIIEAPETVLIDESILKEKIETSAVEVEQLSEVLEMTESEQEPVEVLENALIQPEALSYHSDELLTVSEEESEPPLESSEGPMPAFRGLSEISYNPSEESLQIPIEPLYTIDYFASQGIKLRQEEEQQTDVLSVRLKSFTEWLKAMKKIHPEKLDHKMGQEEENTIRVSAETSNEAKEVYTEALAEVYMQQGLRQKAVTVLEKLSLLDPSKSAYFAARIREIKEI